MLLFPFSKCNCSLILLFKFRHAQAHLRCYRTDSPFLCLRGYVVSWGEGDGTHSSTLAWKIPWTEEPGGLQSMGLLRVRHDWATSLSLFTFMHWRRKWQPTPVFLRGESQGWGSLVGCRLWGRTESDMTEVTQQQQQQQWSPGNLVIIHLTLK